MHGNIAAWQTIGQDSNPHKVRTRCGLRVVDAKVSSARVIALTAALRNASLSAGQRVLLLSRNTDLLLEALVAILACGAVAVPLNVRWKAKEVTSAMLLCQPTLVLCEPCFLALLPEGDCSVIFLGQRSKLAQLHLCTEELISANDGATWCVDKPVNDIAAIIFTSGTTGPAKGVCLTHTSLAFQAKAKLKAHDYNSADIYLHTAPLYHVGGLVSWLAMLMAGATHVLMPAYSAATLLQLVSKHSVTALIAVPTVIVDCLRLAQENQNFPCVRKILLGAGPLLSKFHEPLRRLFPEAKIWTAYGMTEAASSITTATLAETEFPGRQGAQLAGSPPEGIQIAIETGAALRSRSEQVGEILTRGPHLMAGYWNNMTATDAAFLPGGWFKTGDCGFIDAKGQLWLTGRLKDVIRSGGENVASGEVEEILMRHPAVVSVAVVGLPHERLGEQVAALIQTASHGSPELHEPDASSMTSFCHSEGLASFKIPKLLFFQRQPLPVNASGKILKQQVRQLLLQQCAVQSKL